MWGEFVRRAGVGPAPCPVTQLTAAVLIDKLRELARPDIRQAAAALAETMNAEDGVSSALEHFWSALPRDNMMCSVSLLIGQSRLAKYRVGRGVSTSIKLSQEVAGVLAYENIETSNSLIQSLNKRVKTILGQKTTQNGQVLIPHGTVTYALRHRGGYEGFFRGIATATNEFIHEFAVSLLQFYLVPDGFARRYGFFGCILGLILSPLYFLYHMFKTLLIAIDRLGVTIANNVFHKQWLYLIDKRALAKVYREDLLSLPSEKLVSGLNVQHISAAHQVAIAANAIFKGCKPRYPEDHWNWRQVKISALVSSIFDNDGKSKLGLRSEELHILSKRLDWAKTRMDCLSFNRFCLFIGEAVHARFYVPEEENPATDGEAVSDAINCYLN